MIVEYFLLTMSILSLAFFAAGVAILAIERLRVKRVPHRDIEYQPVSVFKPLKGLDNQLEGNLHSFFRLDYPRYEIIFGVNHLEDPAIEVVRRLQNEYPQVDARLIVDESRPGLNPKVNNLINMYPHARYDYFLISDSNVRVRPDYVKDLMWHIQSDNIGLVTSTIRGSGANKIGAVFENLHLNTYIAISVYAVSRIFRIPVTIGKSMFFRRQTLERLGGFEAWKNYLIEDSLLGKGVGRLGMKTTTSGHWIDNYNRDWVFSQFLRRHLRWATMRRRFSTVKYSSEIFSNTVLMSLLYWLWRSDLSGFIFFGGAVLAKISLDVSAAKILKSDLRWWHYLLIPIKDLVMALIWPVPFLSSTVNWRGNYFKVGKNTLLSPAAADSGFTVDSVADAYQRIENTFSGIIHRIAPRG